MDAARGLRSGLVDRLAGDPNGGAEGIANKWMQLTLLRLRLRKAADPKRYTRPSAIRSHVFSDASETHRRDTPVSGTSEPVPENVCRELLTRISHLTLLALAGNLLRAAERGGGSLEFMTADGGCGAARLVTCLALRMALNYGQFCWSVSRFSGGDAVPRSMVPASQEVF